MRWWLTVLIILLPIHGLAQSQEAALERVNTLHEALLASMQMQGTMKQRNALLAPVVLELFDTASIARISTGRAWRDFEDEQRAELIGVLNRLLVATYADRFDSFNGQTFEHVGVAESRTGAIIKTQIKRTNGESVPIDYYFRGDRVFNVVASGVSDLSLRRAEYSSILKEQGYPALITHINDNIREIEDSD